MFPAPPCDQWHRGLGGKVPAAAAVIVGFLVCMELTSGVLQGYYSPLPTDMARALKIRDANVNR